MKRFAILLTGAVCLAFASCKKNNAVTPSINGITVTKDAAAWQTATVSTGFKPLATKDTLFIIAHNNEENIVIALKQKGNGTYQQTEFKAWYYVTLGLDALVAEYELNSDAGNSVTITSYDETTHTLKGSFNLSLKNTYKNGSFADVVKFTDGKIDTQLSDVYMDPLR